MSSNGKVGGFVIALIGGGLGLLAFFAMPFIGYNGVGVSALQIATAGAQFSSSVWMLWIAPVLAGLIVLIAALQFRGSASLSGRRAAGGWLLALGIIGVIMCIVFIVLVVGSGTEGAFYLSLLGIGFWAYLVAMVGVIIGGAMGLSGKAGVAPAPPPITSYNQYQQPPMPQYPPYQQPSSPQYPPYQQPPAPQYPPYQQTQPSSPQYPSYQDPSAPQYPPPQRTSSGDGQQWPPRQ